MATIEDATGNVMEPYELPDWELRMAIRPLWVAFEFWDWTDGDDHLHDKKRGTGGRTIFEHLEQTLCEFRCAERFPAGDLRRMLPTNRGVRSMHSPLLRIYGWCPAPHQFVAVCGALEADTKTNKKLNDEKRDYTLAFIKANKLEHTILRGDNIAVFPPND